MIMIESLNLRDGEVERNLKLTKESNIEEVKLFEELDPWIVRIRKNLPNEFKQKLIALLKKYHEFFTWITVDMLKIDPKITCHKLAINLNVKPVQQKKRPYNQEWATTIKAEVKKLLKIGFIEEMLHAT